MGGLITATLGVVFLIPVSWSGVSDQKGLQSPEPQKSSSSYSSLKGRVVRVVDGDTVLVLLDEVQKRKPLRVRLLGIDAPEKSQAFGEVCRKSLADVVAGRDVRVQVRGQDRYLRTLGVILLRTSEKNKQEQDVNLAQIRSGCAWHYKHYMDQQPVAERQLYAAAEITARKARLGLWKDAHPQAPWDFRHGTPSGNHP
ncbi:MAG: thermonuclease family protein [Bdellovibrionales bacterium]|nr:thermonuclease family protein [Bdellovibrionales bacterium]